MSDQTSSRERIFWMLGLVIIVFYALFPVLWIISLSLKTPATVTEFSNLGQALIPQDPTFDNYSALFTNGLDGPFLKPLINSIGIALIATVIAVVLASFAAYAIARLEFPGKTAVLAGALAIAMFPPISTIGPLFDMWRTLGLYDTWLGPDHPLPELLAAAGDLHARRLLPGDPLGPRAGGPGRRRDPAPGVPQGDRAARRTGHVHRRDPRLHLRLERLPLRDLADQLDASRTVPAALAFFTGESQFTQPFGNIAAAAVICHDPDHPLRPGLPTPDRGRPHIRSRQGLERW